MRRVSGGVVFAQGTVQHSFSADLVSESSSAELALVQVQRTCGAAAGVAAFAAGLQLQSQLIIISRVSWRRSTQTRVRARVTWYRSCSHGVLSALNVTPGVTAKSLLLGPWGLRISSRA